ncbi:hypothetical protein PU629_07085 [Pullulanibacillus sp. KACC 23026]|uniref:hypothetical protein n=1 Tax=Pullulanibacillus sp. KACC 23026 TaxID=3028315 RepID=UPI0023AF6A17|nr:hypothetical protein [Pullulanibacillus sp. KACC 23026]WEG14123.1 hypothetical protein PU629_07085 [Pullulanibacillus sp. KACC 23026]
MNITVTIGLTPELKQFLTGLTNLLNFQTGVPDTFQTATPAPVQQEAAQTPVQSTPVQQMPTQAPPDLQAVPTQAPVPTQDQSVQQQQATLNQHPVTTQVPTSAPEYSFEQLAKAAAQLMDAGKQNDLLQLLSSFGAPALMQLPKEQYGAFATKLRELGAQL